MLLDREVGTGKQVEKKKFPTASSTAVKIVAEVILTVGTAW